MKSHLIITILLISLVQLTSCTTEPEDVITHVHDATIKVSAYQQIGAGGGSTIAIAGATIELYESEDDREYSMNVIKVQTTDSSGHTTFSNLKEDYYYLRCLHPGYGEKLDNVSTPDGTVSFVDFVY